MKLGHVYLPTQKTTPARRNVISALISDRHFVVQARALPAGSIW
jgi:hypothetical protein